MKHMECFVIESGLNPPSKITTCINHLESLRFGYSTCYTGPFICTSHGYLESKVRLYTYAYMHTLTCTHLQLQLKFKLKSDGVKILLMILQSLPKRHLRYLLYESWR